MNDPSESIGRLGHPKRCSPYIDAAPLLTTEWRAEIPKSRPPPPPRRERPHTTPASRPPLGVIRRRGNSPQFVSMPGEPRGHFTRVFSDARRLRRKIGAVDQNPHMCNLNLAPTH